MTTTHTQPAGCDLDSLAQRLRAQCSAPFGPEGFSLLCEAADVMRNLARAAQAPQGDTRQGADTGFVPSSVYRPTGERVMALIDEARKITSDLSTESIPLTLIQIGYITGHVATESARAVREHVALTTPVAHTCTPADQRGDAPVTYMSDEQAFKWAWNTLKKDLGADRWTAGDEVQSWAFFKYGWDYKTQYMKQARAAQGAGTAPVGANVIEMLLDVVRLAYDGMDGTEENEYGLVWDRASFDALSAAMDKLEELPDDQPGYVMGPAAKAAWALQKATHPAPVSTAAATTASASGQILKGIGRIDGDGWKDVTRKGEVVFVWNTELPRPYKAGQFPRIGNNCGWSASTDQYDFQPATAEEAREAIEAIIDSHRAPSRAADGQQGASRAALDVLAERQRQVEVEGWHPDQDDDYEDGQLSMAAACYAMQGDTPNYGPPADWPWDREWWKPADDRRNLVKAGALILADIERIDRAALAAKRGGATDA